MKPEEQFRALTQRIDLLIKDPTSIRAPLTRLARPLLRRFGWQPKPNISQIQSLWGALRSEEPTIEQLQKSYQSAIEELAENITAAERAYIIYRKIPIAYVAWLQRLQVMLEKVERLIANPDDEELRWIASGSEQVSLIPPLSINESSQPEEATPESLQAERSIAVELGAVDHLLALSQREVSSIQRRRSLLEASRRFLLEASAAMPLDASGVQSRLQYIAREMIRLNRMQASGLSSNVSLLHQARTAVSRGDRQLLYRSLLALDSAARSMGDVALATRTRAALQRLSPEAPSPEGTQRSLLASAREMFGEGNLEAIRQAYQAAPDNLPINNETPIHEMRLFREYVKEGAVEQTLFALLSTDGLFEVGGALSPVKLEEQETFLTQVRTPTQRLSLEQTREVQDVPSAVLDDPRAILFSLATGRLLTRRFLREEVRPKTRVVMQSEARIYILDGSGSMLGPRARMRDAILVAELLTLQRRLKIRSFTRSTIYYRYFNDRLGPVHEVESEADINVALDHILANIRTGGTNIDLALVGSFAQIREAKSSDCNLAKAQIVLITDGDAAVDEEAIARAREGLDDIPIGVSVIALGMENQTLKALVAKQRATGESAFYHFVPDDLLSQYCGGAADPQGGLHLPMQGVDPAAESRELQSSFGGLLDELASLERARDVESLERLESDASARRDAGVEESSLSEGERARIEATHQNRRALQLRFERWFPAPAKGRATNELPSGQEQQEVEAILLIHAALCEVIGVVGGSDLMRRSDAIELLDRLLVDARITPRRYEELVTKFANSFTTSLTAVHQMITPNKNNEPNK